MMNRLGDIRALTKGEVYARIAGVNRGGVKILLYKKAGTDAAVLNEIFGRGMWGVKYHHTAARLNDRDIVISDCELQIPQEYAMVSVTGTSDTIKAEAAGTVRDVSSIDNDAMKRAGFLLGIGEELFTAEIFVPQSRLFTFKAETVADETGKGHVECTCDDIISIYDLQVTDEKKISSLVLDIRSDYRGTHETLYTAIGKKPETAEAPAAATVTAEAKEAVKAPEKAEKETAPVKAATHVPAEAKARTEAKPAAPAKEKGGKLVIGYDEKIAFGKFRGMTYGEARKKDGFMSFLNWIAGQKPRVTDPEAVRQFNALSELGKAVKAGKSLDEAEKAEGVKAAA